MSDVLHGSQPRILVVDDEEHITELVAMGLSNAEIAARVQRSERTVEHHVSALLAKLGVARRAQAVVRLQSVVSRKLADD